MHLEIFNRNADVFFLLNYLLGLTLTRRADLEPASRRVSKLAEGEGFEPPRDVNPNGFQDRLTTIITTLQKLRKGTCSQPHVRKEE